MKTQLAIKVACTAIAALITVSTAEVEAQAQAKSTAASASKKKPKTNRKPSAGKTAASSSATKPRTDRSRAAYKRNARAFDMRPSVEQKRKNVEEKKQRREARRERRAKRADETAQLRQMLNNGERAQAARANAPAKGTPLADAPPTNPNTTADALRNAARNGFPATDASRQAALDGKAPIGGGKRPGRMARFFGDLKSLFRLGKRN